MALILDTGPLFAGLDGGDPDHEACATLIASAEEDLLVPMLVLAELDYFCRRQLTPEAWLVFLDDLLAGVYTVVAPSPIDLQRCRELEAEYTDLDLGIVDASIIALAERLDEPKVATLDHRHFSVVRPAHRPALHLLPGR
ncbi:MAG: PIN domain-containing protein [Solirubrobacterales bacterium]